MKGLKMNLLKQVSSRLCIKIDQNTVYSPI